MSKAKIIKEAFRSAAIGNGFVESGAGFQKALNEVIWTLELVKERGTSYSIASGVWVRNISGNGTLMKDHGIIEKSMEFVSCHIRPRIDRYSKTRGKYSLDELLDSRSDLDDDLRREEFGVR